MGIGFLVAKFETAAPHDFLLYGGSSSVEAISHIYHNPLAFCSTLSQPSPPGSAVT